MSTDEESKKLIEQFDLVHSALMQMNLEYLKKYGSVGDITAPLHQCLGLAFTLTGEAIMRFCGEVEIKRLVKIIEQDKAKHLRTLVEIRGK